MKKITLSIMTAFMMMTLIPVQVSAGTETNKVPMSAPVTNEAIEANALIARLYEIKAMDLSNMKSGEKKQLRHEVKSIKSHLKALSGGVYLSVGAIIVILLILLLIV